MQIVIDIDDMAHDWLVNGFPDEDDMEMAIRAIKNGTPLPDNHGRLIDADALRLSDLAPEPWYRPMWGYSESEIDYAPTILEATRGE